MIVDNHDDIETQNMVHLIKGLDVLRRCGGTVSGLKFSMRHFKKLFSSRLLFLQEIVVGDNMDKIYIVMDYVEHDLKSLMESMTQPFLVGNNQFKDTVSCPLD